MEHKLAGEGCSQLGSAFAWGCVMANQRAREGILHVPSKGGVQHGARNNSSRLAQQGEDPALALFLQVLDDHVSAHPEQLQPMTTDLVARLDDLVGAVDVDLDAPLEAEQKGLRSTKAHVECLRSIGLGSHALPSSGTQSVVSAKCLPGSVGADPGSSRQAD